MILYALIFDNWSSDCAGDYKEIWMLRITDTQDGKVHVTLNESYALSKQKFSSFESGMDFPQEWMVRTGIFS